MKNHFLLLLFLMAGLCAHAEAPNAALVSIHNQAKDDGSTLNIVNLQSIQLVLNEHNQVQSVFVFEDQSTVVFDNVEAIEFMDEENAVSIDFNPSTDIESVSAIQLSVSPNPAKDMIHISGMKEDSRGVVFNISGQRICDINGQQTDLNVSTWANGTYIIRIDNEIFKLIKQ